MTMRRGRRIRIERGAGPQGIPSVSVDAATAARHYGPLGHDTGGPIQPVGEFYDIRASQEGGHPAFYEGTVPWFEGLDKPTRQPSLASASPSPREMLDQPPAASARYRGEKWDFRKLMQAFMAMAEGMDPSTYEPSPYMPQSVMPEPGESAATSPAVEAMVDEIATNEPACYQVLTPAPEAAAEPTPAFDPSAMMEVAGIAPTPTAEDGLVALVQSMAEQQQEQASQSLEAMVQDQMSLFGPAVAEDPVLREQAMVDMMLLNMGLGPGW